ncbi:MAG: hypothetical protein HZB55_20400 [Deltaproteobacteria bacterium]|nr:hypothetical protein [Deltaproteobacteria bacterium]
MGVFAALDRSISHLSAGLNARHRRHAAISSNVANVDTSGYKAVDVSFAAALRRAQGAPSLAAAKTDERHLSGSSPPVGARTSWCSRVPNLVGKGTRSTWTGRWRSSLTTRSSISSSCSVWRGSSRSSRRRSREDQVRSFPHGFREFGPRGPGTVRHFLFTGISPWNAYRLAHLIGVPPCS